jgi:quercetin dioxygenase-like cupin family protein
MEDPMFYKKDNLGYREAIPGVWMKTLVYGEKTLLAEFNLKAGYSIPQHAHEHEQTGYLVSGAIQLTIDETTYDVKPGDAWCINGNVKHNVAIIDDSFLVEVFSPVRKDYLPEPPK